MIRFPQRHITIHMWMVIVDFILSKLITCSGEESRAYLVVDLSQIPREYQFVLS